MKKAANNHINSDNQQLRPKKQASAVGCWLCKRYAINMKALIFALFTLLLSSCASISDDDQFVSLSSDTSQKLFVVEIYNREIGVNNTVSIKVHDDAQEAIILKPKQVATVFLDELDAGEKEPVLVFVLPSGEEVESVLPSYKAIEKSIAPQLNDKVYVCIENGEVSQLNSDEWYSKLNKDRVPGPTEVLMLVTAPITVPVFLASYMIITLVGPLIE